jgi:cysteine desulfurase
MMPFLGEWWGNPSSAHRFGIQARIAVERARRRVADHVVCKPSEIVFCSSGTEADNLALRGAAFALKARGAHIVTTTIEHPAVLNTCRALANEGFRVTYVPVTSVGFVEPAAVAACLGDDTILVSVMHANNETGVVQPVEEIASITGKRGIVFQTDAVQSVGKLPLHLAGIGAVGSRVPNTSNMSLRCVDGESIILGLDVHGIYASTGSACSTGDPEPSHVLLAMGLSPREAQGSIRFSLGRETRKEDIDVAVRVVKDVVVRLRSI